MARQFIYHMSGLSKSYGNKKVLEDIHLSFYPDAKIGILGPNGAGKSTTLKSVSGLLTLEDGEVTAGEVRFRGKDVKGVPPERLVRDGLFHVMEGRRVFEDLTVEENLIAATYALSGSKPSLSDSYELDYSYFHRLKESRKQLAGYLSGGEQQMLAIGRALMSKPRLLLLDEPSLGLAPIIIAQIFDTIARLRDEKGMTVFLVEQNANQALKLSDRGYVLENGHIVMQGSGEDLLTDPNVRDAYLGG